MSIVKLSADKYESFGVERSPVLIGIAKELEWYSDEAGNVLGIVIQDKIDKDYSYVVLGRDLNGKFRAIDVNASIETQAKAKAELHQKLLEHIKAGTKVFPQGDEKKKKR